MSKSKSKQVEVEEEAEEEGVAGPLPVTKLEVPSNF
jgi:hypothetical protein